jgi:hypothetical protein
MVFGDSTHILDTKGFDFSHIPPGSTNESFQWRLIGTTGTQAGVPEPIAYDFDGDDKADLVWHSTQTGTVAVWLLRGTSVTSTAVVASGVDPNWQIVGAEDVDGDRKADLLWRHTQTGAVAVWLLRGTSVIATAILGATDLSWQIAHVADVDGDGRADLVWYQPASGQAAVWLLRGTSVASQALVGFAVGPGWRLK